MTPEEIKKVIAAWYSLDPSYHAALALHKHGVKANEVLAMKNALSWREWFMTYSKLRTLEQEKTHGVHRPKGTTGQD